MLAQITFSPFGAHKKSNPKPKFTEIFTSCPSQKVKGPSAVTFRNGGGRNATGNIPVSEQPAKLVTVTEYKPDCVISITGPVSPVDYTKSSKGRLNVKSVTVSPMQ